MPDPDVDKIRDLCRRLGNILGDPHPGLGTWHEARVSVGTELRDALNAVLPEETTNHG